MSTIDSYLVRLARAFEFCMAKPRQGTRTNANDRLPRPVARINEFLRAESFAGVSVSIAR